MNWPGEAAVVVALVSIFKGSWKNKLILDQKQVPQINSYLDSQIPIRDPSILSQNDNRAFVGSYVLGTGFVLSHDEARRIIQSDSKYSDVVFPYLNGKDLNNEIDQNATRSVINYFDWTEERSQKYELTWQIIQERVRQERQRWKIDSKGNEIEGVYALRKPLPQRYWQYADKRPALYSTIKGMEKVMVLAQVSKTVAFSLVPNQQVFDAKLIVVAFSNYSSIAIYQSLFSFRMGMEILHYYETRFKLYTIESL